MYERMLDKSIQPTFEEMLAHTGRAAKLWEELEQHLGEICGAERTIRFPYGNSYGWGGGYKRKSKHICDVFAEKEAISLLLQINKKVMETILPELEESTVNLWKEGYPCGSGRWISFRITTEGQLKDAKKIVAAKAGVYSS